MMNLATILLPVSAGPQHSYRSLPRYTDAHRTAFGSFRPLCAWRLRLNDYVLDLATTESQPLRASDGQLMQAEDEYALDPQLDIISNEHFLYPLWVEEDRLYFPTGTGSHVWEVDRNDTSVRRKLGGAGNEEDDG